MNAVTPPSLPVIDYASLFSPDKVASALGDIKVSTPYGNNQGVVYKYNQQGIPNLLEVCRLSDDIFLILSHCKSMTRSAVTHSIGGGGWVHIQFRIQGQGQENLGSEQPNIETLDNTYFISHYPNDTLVTRENFGGGSWKTACLFLRPQLINDFFHLSNSAFPDQIRWINDDTIRTAQWFSAAMDTSSIATINDMMACSFQGQARNLFMRAKSLELMATLLHSLNSNKAETTNPHLSGRDIQCIKTAHNIIQENISHSLTLQTMSRKVGLNRTKLAVGFKSFYGVSLQSYWRDLRLSRARDLLRSGNLSVTEVACQVGYAESTSFTRAFVKRYGSQPKELKSNANRAQWQLEK
jgi:AraC family transcriptional regulator, transcriptional activator of the genes for pyochelin and ferripyochelin receptors